MKEKSTEEFVVTGVSGGMLPYDGYFKILRKSCAELKIPVIGTHGLRHSTSELYMSHGASRDDIRELFAHSSSDVTERYIQQHDSRLERVTNVIKLFSKGSTDPQESIGTAPKNQAILENGSI